MNIIYDYNTRFTPFNISNADPLGSASLKCY